MTPPDNKSTGLDGARIGGGADYPSPDELFRVLASSERRRLLAVLPSQSSMTLNELTDVLAGWQSTVDGPLGPDEWAQVKIELVHAHLPMLCDAGLVTHEDDEVALAACPKPVEQLLTFAAEYEEALADNGSG